jgi:hypothetical protein
VRALVALDRKAEALRYAEASGGINAPVHAIASACEEILLSSGLQAEAYQRYARLANEGATHLATFRLLVRKYPSMPPADILGDLIASTPGSEGQWFAAAKDAGLFDIATHLATNSPVDPRTLARAARDFAVQRPDFAVAVGLAALHWIAHGHGYDITSKDVLDAYAPLMEAAPASSMGLAQVRQKVSALIGDSSPFGVFLQTVLDSRLR